MCSHNRTLDIFHILFFIFIVGFSAWPQPFIMQVRFHERTGRMSVRFFVGQRTHSSYLPLRWAPCILVVPLASGKEGQTEVLLVPTFAKRTAHADVHMPKFYTFQHPQTALAHANMLHVPTFANRTCACRHATRSNIRKPHLHMLTCYMFQHCMVSSAIEWQRTRKIVETGPMK